MEILENLLLTTGCFYVVLIAWFTDIKRITFITGSLVNYFSLDILAVIFLFFYVSFCLTSDN